MTLRAPYWISVALLVCSGLLAAFDYWSIRGQLERVRQDDLRASMQRLVNLIASSSTEGIEDIEWAAWWRFIGSAAIDAPHLQYIALIDEEAGMRVAYPETGWADTQAELDPPPPANWRDLLRRADGSTLWHDTGRGLLWGAIPIPGGATNEERQTGRFALLVADTRGLSVQTGQEAGQHALSVFGGALVILAALGWILQRFLFGRIERLLAYARSGEAVREAAEESPVGGHDEVAELGFELRSLRRQLVHGRNEVAHLIDSLPNPVWRTDRDGNCTYVNQAWLEFTGRPRAAELGRAWAHDVHPDDLQQCLAEVARASVQRAPFSLEYRMKHKDGRYRWLRDHAEPVYDHEGEFQGYLGASYDIQDILDTSEALAASELRFRGLVENSSVGVYLYQHRRLVYCNPRMAEMLGCASDALTAEELGRLIHPDDLRPLWRRLLRLQRGVASSGQHEFRVRRSDGRRLWVAVFGSRIVQDGAPAIIGTLIDISERRQAEENIRNSEENLRVTLQSIGDGVIATDAAGLVTLMNPVAEGLTGWLEFEAHGLPLERVLRLLDPETRGDLHLPRDGCEAPGAWSQEALLLARDGRERPVAFKGSPIRLEAEHDVAGGVLVLRDQTEQQQLIAALRDGERRYRALFDANPHPMWVYDLSSGAFLAVNDAAVSHYGYTRAEFLGMTLADLVASGPSPTSPERSDSGLAQHGIQRHRLKDGHLIEVEAVSHTLDFGGRNAELVLANDVTERRVAEAALLASEARFRALFEQAAVGVAQFERDTGRFVQVNRRCCAILGRTPEQIVGARFETMMHADDLPTYRQCLAELQQGQRAEFYLEQRWCREDGTEVPVYVAVTSMALPGGGPSDQCIAVIEDVSARKGAERAVRQFQFMVESALEEIYLAKPSGDLVYANAAAAQSLGYSVEEVLRLGFGGVDLVYGPTFPSFFAALKQGESSVVETTHAARNGRRMTKELQAVYLQIDDQEFACAFARDITERKQAEERLRLAGKVFQAAREAILVTDCDRRIIAVNPAFEEMTGYSQDEVIGKDPRILRSDLHDEDFYTARWRTIEREGSWRGEIWNRQKNGRISPVMQTIVEVRDTAGALVNYISVSTDISTLKRAEERVRRLAYYDALTGLPNRELLADRAKLALAQHARSQKQLAVLFLDLDRFKYVNDSLGHQEGDTLLKKVAGRLEALVRETDTIARVGGDEFVLLLPGVGRDGASNVADKIMESFNTPFEISGDSFAITVSIGISLFPHDGTHFDALLKNADTAMYRSKQMGRNACRFYDADMNVATLQYLKLMSALRKAVQSGELRTYFQPKIRLTDGTLVGSEALVRWVHPEEGLLLPGHFISAAERTDLIVSIGNWVLDDVCRQLAQWRDEGFPPMTVAVNVSARHVSEPGLAERLRELLDKYRLPPHSLELELTESTLLETGEQTLSTLEQLKCQGVDLAIDDFGMGYSSLSYLKHLPLASLKIDRSFVRDMTTDSDDRTIAATVVALGHSLGLKVVAEGVESEQQRDILISQGCDFAQGYLFSQPLSSDDFTVWWQSHLAAQGRSLGGRTYNA